MDYLSFFKKKRHRVIKDKQHWSLASIGTCTHINLNTSMHHVHSHTHTQKNVDSAWGTTTAVVFWPLSTCTLTQHFSTLLNYVHTHTHILQKWNDWECTNHTALSRENTQYCYAVKGIALTFQDIDNIPSDNTPS